MSPVTHLLASWMIAAKTTDNPRDCRLVTLAGVLPDADGFGLLVDAANYLLGRGEGFYSYQRYHHWLMHGLFGGIFIALLLACFAHRRWQVALLALITFHLHVLCDLVGSRGPAPDDVWPIYYLGPLSRRMMWVWDGQWRLDGWINRVITLIPFFWALWLAATRQDSVVGVFNRRADKVFVEVMHRWRLALLPQSHRPNKEPRPADPQARG